MYYVALHGGPSGFKYVRYLGGRPEWDDDQRPSFIRRYELEELSDAELDEEAKRVESGIGYDPWARVAIMLERERRAGKEVPTTDDWETMQDMLM